MGELIDFNDPAPNSANNFDPRHPEQFGNLEGDRPSSPGAAGHAPLANLAFPPSAEPGSTSHRDPFDMSPFAVHPPATVLSTGGGSSEAAADLKSEIWYHGPISRIDAETLLVNDGDFLVRESKGSRGQYVLTGMQQNSKKHLLLVDPEGVVRTKDRAFDCVSHLINHHMNNGLPIISAESALRLRTPVQSANAQNQF